MNVYNSENRKMLESQTSKQLQDFCFLKAVQCLDFKNIGKKSGTKFIKYDDLDNAFAYLSDVAVALIKVYYVELYSPTMYTPSEDSSGVEL